MLCAEQSQGTGEKVWLSDTEVKSLGFGVRVNWVSSPNSPT